MKTETQLSVVAFELVELAATMRMCYDKGICDTPGSIVDRYKYANPRYADKIKLLQPEHFIHVFDHIWMYGPERWKSFVDRVNAYRDIPKRQSKLAYEQTYAKFLKDMKRLYNV